MNNSVKTTLLVAASLLSAACSLPAPTPTATQIPGVLAQTWRDLTTSFAGRTWLSDGTLSSSRVQAGLLLMPEEDPPTEMMLLVDVEDDQQAHQAALVSMLGELGHPTTKPEWIGAKACPI